VISSQSFGQLFHGKCRAGRWKHDPCPLWIISGHPWQQLPKLRVNP
jgi:hypothetical protein